MRITEIRSSSLEIPATTTKQRALLSFFAVVVVAIALLDAKWRPLWFDELFTYYVSSEYSLRATLSALLLGADIHPPIDYLLRHISMSILGDTSVAFRLPSVLAVLAGLFAIYSYVRLRAPFIGAVAAFAFPLVTIAAPYMFEGRPYGVLFASAALSLVAWQRATLRLNNKRPLLALTAALTLGPFSHYFGVLNFVPIVMGESWRSMRRRQIDWGVVTSIATAGALLPLLLVFARNATSMQTGWWGRQFSLGEAIGFYHWLFDYSIVPLLFAFVLVSGVLSLGRGRLERTPPLDVPSHEIVGAIAFCLTPMWCYLLARAYVHALTPRFSIATVVGVAVLVGYAIAAASATSKKRAIAIVAVIALLGIVRLVRVGESLRGVPAVPSAFLEAVSSSQLVVAFDASHAFLEYTHYEPELARARFVYPMDPDTAMAISGVNTSEIALLGLSRIVKLNVASYKAFLDTHDEFLVLYDPNSPHALLPALLRDNVCLELVRRIDDKLLFHANRLNGCRRSP